MSVVRYTCIHCNAKLKVPTSLLGVSGPCPKCGQALVVDADGAKLGKIPQKPIK